MSKNLVNNPAELAQVLAMLTKESEVSNGEKLLKPFLKNSGCLLALTNQIIHASDGGIKLQASFLIKRRLPKLYSKLNAHDKHLLRSQLLHLLVSPQEKPVGTALAGCVAAVAKGVFVKDKSNMPDLFQVLTELAANADNRQRSLAYSLLAQLAETIAKHLVPHTSTLATMLITGCQDSSTDVSIEAMKAASIYIQQISSNEKVMELKTVISPILNVLSNCLQGGDELVVLEGFDVLEECAKMEYPLINDHVEMIVPFLINIIQSDTLDYGLKYAASVTFNTLLESRPKLIGKKNMVFPCLEAFVNIIAKSRGSAAGSIFSFINEEKNITEGNDSNEDDEDDEDIAKVAQTCINVMALNLPSKYFVQPALTICSQCINHPDPHMRKAGAALLGIITEGCEDNIKPLLPDIVPKLTALCQDPEILVRECASFAIGQLSEYTQPDILHYYSAIIPTILHGLDDSSKSVQGTSCYVVEQFVEYLEPPIIRPYLNILIEKLVLLLQNPQRVSREITLAAIAATAVAAEIEFIPYMDGVVNILSNFLFLDNEKLFDVRGRALECLGHLAIAVGKDHFQMYFDLGMRSVMQATQMDQEILKEFGYIYIANIARAMTTSFASYLPSLVPHLIEVITESEVTHYVNEEDLEENHEDNKDTNDNDEDDDDDDYELNIEEGFVNTKKAAITALGALAEHTQEAFVPFLSQSIEAILSNEKGSFHSLHIPIRSESVSIIQHFVNVAKSGTIEIRDYKPSKGIIMPILPGTPFMEVLSIVMNSYLRTIGTDEDKETVSNAIEGVVEVLDNIGQSALMIPCTLPFDPKSEPIMGLTNPNMLVADVLMKQIYELLSEHSPCQKKKESSSHGQSANYDHLDDDTDHEKHILDSVADLLGCLPKHIGSAFIPYFDEFCKLLVKYSKPNRPYNDRSMVVGIFAEVIFELGSDSYKYVEMILPIIQHSLLDPIEGVRRNAAFCIAAIVESHFTVLTQEQVYQFLQWLQPIFSKESQSTGLIGFTHVTSVVGADIDNGLSVLARMITKLPNYIPLDQVLPVMIQSLPIRVDPLEGMTVYGCVLSLVTRQDSTAIRMLPQILQVLSITLNSESKSITKETKELIRSAVKEYSNPSHPIYSHFQSAVTQIPTQLQGILQSAITNA